MLWSLLLGLIFFFFKSNEYADEANVSPSLDNCKIRIERM